jgi:hypothetical protein
MPLRLVHLRWSSYTAKKDEVSHGFARNSG